MIEQLDSTRKWLDSKKGKTASDEDFAGLSPFPPPPHSRSLARSLSRALSLAPCAARTDARVGADRKKEIEKIWNPLVSKAYQVQAPSRPHLPSIHHVPTSPSIKPPPPPALLHRFRCLDVTRYSVPRFTPQTPTSTASSPSLCVSACRAGAGAEAGGTRSPRSQTTLVLMSCERGAASTGGASMGGTGASMGPRWINRLMDFPLARRPSHALADHDSRGCCRTGYV